MKHWRSVLVKYQKHFVNSIYADLTMANAKREQMEMNSDQDSGQCVQTIDPAPTPYGFTNPTFATTSEQFGAYTVQSIPFSYEQQQAAPTVVWMQPQTGAYVPPPPAKPIKDYLVFSIIVMLCCCLPAGIVATIMSCGVRDAVAAGKYAGM